MPAQPSSALVESAGKLTDAPISRRTLAKGAAWSVPVIAAAIAAPAAVASNIALSVTSVCAPGSPDSPARVTFTITNTLPKTLRAGTKFTVTATNIGITSVNGSASREVVLGDIPPNGSTSVLVITSGQPGGGQNSTATVAGALTQGTSPDTVSGGLTSSRTLQKATGGVTTCV
jgi:hypothetical protein